METAGSRAKAQVHGRSSTLVARELRATKAYVIKVTKTKDASIALLQRAGIVTKSGNLSKPYKA